MPGRKKSSHFSRDRRRPELRKGRPPTDSKLSDYTDEHGDLDRPPKPWYEVIERLPGKRVFDPEQLTSDRERAVFQAISGGVPLTQVMKQYKIGSAAVRRTFDTVAYVHKNGHRPTPEHLQQFIASGRGFASSPAGKSVLSSAPPIPIPPKQSSLPAGPKKSRPRRRKTGPTLKDLIIQMVTENPTLSQKEIQRLLAKKGRPTSKGSIAGTLFYARKEGRLPPKKR